MADVTEVIHKITYEVNNDALNNATSVIQLQIAELNKLAKVLDNYTRQLERLSATESAKLDDITRKIEKVNSDIIILSAKSKGQLQEILNGFLKGMDIPDSIKSGVAAYIKQVRTEFNSLDSAGKSIGKGLGSNLQETVAGLGKSLLSVNGLLKLGVGLFAEFATAAYNAGKQTDGVKEKLDELHTNLGNIETGIFDAAGKQLARIQYLESVVNNQSLSMDVRLGAIRQMKEEMPEYFGYLDDEAIKYDKIRQAVKNASEAILLKAASNAAYAQFEEVSSQKFLQDRKTKKIDEQIASMTKNIPKKDLDMFIESRESDNEVNAIGYTNRLFLKGVDPGKLGKLLDERKASIKLAASLKKEAKELLEEAGKLDAEAQGIIDKNKKLTNLTEQDQKKITGATYIKPTTKKKPEKPARPQEPVSYMETGKPQLLPIVPPSDKVKTVDAERIIREQREKEEAEAAAKRKENIKSAIDDYKVLSEAAVEAYNTIIQAQIDALDKEISLRGKRVEEAKSLAEKGNVEALRIEEERLRKAQEQRARFARQQQIVNSAITVSNAIAAVARAALEGGGFGSAATIAALIAALAAGYAAVTSMSNDGGESFADGVVGYNGKGGPRDDKNWVRISNGESVITAAGTHKNRALLEAINSGATLHMIEPSLPFVMPLLKQPGQINSNAYASAGDLRKLEGKLDDVVGAIQDNKLRQNIFFNEHGVGIMTEKAIKKEQRRWK